MFDEDMYFISDNEDEQLHKKPYKGFRPIARLGITCRMRGTLVHFGCAEKMN